MSTQTESVPAKAGGSNDKKKPAPLPPAPRKHQLALWEVVLVVGAAVAMVGGFVYQLGHVKDEAARSFDLKGRLVRQYLDGRVATTQDLAARLRAHYGAGRGAALAGVRAADGAWSLPGTAAGAGDAQGGLAGQGVPTAAVQREAGAARGLDAPAAALLAAESDVAAVSYVSANHFTWRLARSDADGARYDQALYAAPAWAQAGPEHNAAGRALVAGVADGGHGPRLHLAAPVQADGTFLGVLSVELAPAVLQGLMDAGDGAGQILLVDAQGQLLVRPGTFSRDESYPVPASGIYLWEDSQGTAWAAQALDGGRLYLLQRLSLWQLVGAALARALPMGLVFVLGACVIVLGLRLREALQAVTQQDRRDPLTRALNRRGLFEDAVPLHAVGKRNRKPIAVLTLDVDFFRQLNEQFGHDAGDKVLCALTTGLREHVREYDVIARWSSEIFVVLLMVEHDADALPVAERLRGMVATTVHRDALLSVTVSAGLSMWADDEAIEVAIARSEEMLYAAKAAGRDRLQAAPDVVRPVYAPSGEQVNDAPAAGEQARG